MNLSNETIGKRVTVKGARRNGADFAVSMIHDNTEMVHSGPVHFLQNGRTRYLLSYGRLSTYTGTRFRTHATDCYIEQ